MNTSSLRGKDLDDALQKVLSEMLSDGVNTSPIRNGSVFLRMRKLYSLESKATLSKPHRRELIRKSAELQLELAGLSQKQATSLIEKKNRKDQLFELSKKVHELESGLAECIETTLSMIRAVEHNTAIPVERLLGPILKQAQKR